jgi:hypothetical protein
MFSHTRIKHTHIIDDPFNDPPGFSVPDQSPEEIKDETGVRYRYNV